MDFKKKLKIRLIMAIGFIVLGAMLIIIGCSAANDILKPFGILIAAIGIARVLQYLKLTKNQSTLSEREIAENDERNIMLYTSARALAFNIYVITAAAAMIILYALGKDTAAQTIAYTLFGFIAIYLICHFVISRRY